MAIAFDSATSSNTTGTSLSYSKTCTGSNLILFVSVADNSGTAEDFVTGVTYAGVSMTLACKQVTGVGVDPIYLFYLLNPAVGANNVIVSASTSIPIYSSASSYAGASQTGQPDAVAVKQQSGVTSTVQTISVVASGCWIISACSESNNGNPTIGTGLNATRTVTLEARIGDTDGVVSSGTNSVTWNGGGGSNFGVVIASFSPSGATTTTLPFQTLLGVGI